MSTRLICLTAILVLGAAIARIIQTGRSQRERALPGASGELVRNSARKSPYPGNSRHSVFSGLEAVRDRAYRRGDRPGVRPRTTPPT
jgi:hypothetical protein